MRLIDADKLCEDLLNRWSIADTRKEELIRQIMADIVTPIVVGQPTINNWIPCSERLPEKSGLYLTWTKFPYEEEPSWLIINYDADCESFGEWKEHYHPDTLGYLDSEFNEFENVFAWMPLPEPYREEGGQV